MSLESSQAVVLNFRPYGELDKIVTVYSEKKGRVTGMAKAAQHSRKRFGGRLDYFSLVNLYFEEKKRTSLFFFKHVELIENFESMKSSPLRCAYAGYLCELIMKMTPEREGDPSLFNVFKNVLGRLNTELGFKKYIRFFEIFLLKKIGLFPLLESCLGCQKKISFQEYYDLSFIQGGLYCFSCSQGKKIDWRLEKSVFDFLRNEPVEIEKLKDPENLKLQDFLHSYFSFQHGYDFKSVRYIKEIEKVYS
ncbi:MAG: DNA repair protein RecO [Deltaproteobacteria bacterium]|nr:DNA repair protein RecO [Deltaproteobacteria bacterium]